MAPDAGKPAAITKAIADAIAVAIADAKAVAPASVVAVAVAVAENSVVESDSSPLEEPSTSWP